MYGSQRTVKGRIEKINCHCRRSEGRMTIVDHSDQNWKRNEEEDEDGEKEREEGRVDDSAVTMSDDERAP